MADDVKESSGCGGVMGYQLPVGTKGKKKKKVTEAADCAPESSEMDMEGALREVIRARLREIVRKKPGGGGWLLYAPNPGKKKNPKPVGEFPTKLGAKSAELQRFPPKDPDKLKKSRASIDKLRKNPKKAAEKEREADKSAKGKKSKKENVERAVKDAIRESLFREAPDSSAWDELMARLSKQAVMSDKKLQQFEKLIGKQSETALRDGVKAIQASLKKSKFIVQSAGEVKKGGSGKMFVPFSISDKEGAASVGPIFLFIEDGRVKIEVSESARSGMTQLDGARSKILKGELVGMQEDLLDSMDSVVKIVKKRDDYLTKMQDSLDDYVGDLSALEISMLKNLLVNKYRKI